MDSVGALLLSFPAKGAFILTVSPQWTVLALMLQVMLCCWIVVWQTHWQSRLNWQHESWGEWPWWKQDISAGYIKHQDDVYTFKVKFDIALYLRMP